MFSWENNSVLVSRHLLNNDRGSMSLAEKGNCIKGEKYFGHKELVENQFGYFILISSLIFLGGMRKGEEQPVSCTFVTQIFFTTFGIT